MLLLFVHLDKVILNLLVQGFGKFGSEHKLFSFFAGDALLDVSGQGAQECNFRWIGSSFLFCHGLARRWLKGKGCGCINASSIDYSVTIREQILSDK